ncbi:GlxA family transcriptional regulator [Pararhizobium sp. YC-54]|uniref:GlxA family transcriptional regulator n=1 Tax=Pararhizobium sp. YC-54 TaxID=2986920 RepID=UPI0021F7FE3F|nr:GlxA family transcriptional regulator [Pararhizobium sp. YC-54]MCV9999490.1 GlxA family transcriptional regulator [Pararhizobium sp. YC-54]
MHVAFILTAGYSLMATASAVEPLRAANHLAGQKLYDISFLSTGGGRARSTAGGEFETLPLTDAGLDYDIVLVVAGGNPMSYEDPELNRYLRRLSGRNVKLGGISGGPAILARLGLMENRRFAVHWQHIEALQELSSDFLVERRLFVIDRDRYTCAGGVSALDMMLAIVASEHGTKFAQAVSDWFIHTQMRMANDPSKSSLAQQLSISHPALVAATDLMASHLADPLTEQQIADLSGLSSRQLQRLFSEQIGEPIMQFYRRLRLAKANELLQQSTLPITEVAVASGFSSLSHFSRAFRDQFKITPRQRRIDSRRDMTVVR